MYIERIFLSQMLGVKQSNIRKVSQVKENINVQLWNSGEQVTIPKLQYAEYVEAFRKKNKTHLDTLQKQFKVPDTVQLKGNRGAAKRLFGVCLMIFGAIMSIRGFTINTTVSTSYGSVSNISLINEQNKQLQLGGIAFIAGAIFYCLDG